MGKKLYVGNLSYNMDSSTLNELFAQHGNVQSAEIISDRETGRSKGFGFVEMSSEDEAQAAINAMNGREVDGRSLTVNEAKPRSPVAAASAAAAAVAVAAAAVTAAAAAVARVAAAATAVVAAAAVTAAAAAVAAAVAAAASATDPFARPGQRS